MRNILSTLKVGFDLDSVLARTDEASIAWYQAKGLLGPEFTAQQITDWNHYDCLPVTKEAMIQQFTSDEFFATIPAAREAVSLTYHLARNGAEVHVVTNRPCPIVTAKWLATAGVRYHRLEFIKAEEKPNYASMMGLDYFLEDHPKTAFDLARTVPGLSFIHDKPYNRNAGLHPKLHRFYHWPEIAEFFRIDP